jgi:hypothetical protein
VVVIQAWDFKRSRLFCDAVFGNNILLSGSHQTRASQGQGGPEGPWNAARK